MTARDEQPQADSKIWVPEPRREQAIGPQHSAGLSPLAIRLFCARGNLGEPLTCEHARQIGTALLRGAGSLKAENVSM